MKYKMITIRINKITLTCFTLLICMLIFASAYGADYFVTSTGSDSNSGVSEASAFKTLSRLNAQKLQAGDRIFLRRGVVWDEALNLHGAGRKDSLIVYSAYGNGPSPEVRQVFYRDYLGDVSFNVVESLRISNLDGIGVDLTGLGSEGVVIRNCEIAFCAGEGLRADCDGRQSFSNFLIEKCYIHDNRLAGVLVGQGSCVNSNVIVRNCTFFNNGFSDGKTANTDNCTVGGGEAIVEYCFSGSNRDWGSSGIDSAAKNTVIRYCMVEGSIFSGIKVNADDSAVVVIHHNMLIKNKYGLEMHPRDGSVNGPRAFINNNAFIKNSSSGFYFTNSNETQLFNNVFWGNGGDGSFSDSQIYIGMKFATQSNAVDALLANHNLLYPEEGQKVVRFRGLNNSIDEVYEWETWKNLGKDASGIYGSPNLTVVAGKGINMLDGSPCVGAGYRLSSEYEMAIDASKTDFSTIPPNVRLVNQNEFGKWDIGPVSGIGLEMNDNVSVPVTPDNLRVLESD